MKMKSFRFTVSLSNSVPKPINNHGHRTRKKHAPVLQTLHAPRIEDMRINQVRKDIEHISKPILLGLGFIEVGLLGESMRSSDSGMQAVFLDCVKDRDSISISVRVFVRYNNIEAIYGSSESTYTISKLLASESIGLEEYCEKNLKEMINRLVSVKAIDFLNEFAAEKEIFSNLTDANYKVWVTAGKVSQFKVKLAFAALTNDFGALTLAKKEALNYCDKPRSEPDREEIKGLCASV